MHRLLLCGLAVLLCGCSGGQSTPSEDRKPTISVTSTAFMDGEMIPTKYTADGAGVSPALAWKGIPDGTRSIAVVCDDPDAPGKTWTHWLLWNLPPDTSDLPEHMTEKSLPGGAKQGTNDAVGIGYGPPGPPRGDKPHRYFFKVYALDKMLDLKEGAHRAEFDAAMKGHILAWGQVMGAYGRK
jgi:Raf kinase inhibitor-like YbhB/YbcL family protein